MKVALSARIPANKVTCRKTGCKAHALSGKAVRAFDLLVFMKTQTAVLAGALTLVVSTQAQTISQPSTQARDDFDPVVISASRMEQPRSASAVIVDVISRTQIEQSGASNVAEFLDTVGGVSLSRLYGRAGVDASLDIGYMGEAGSQNVLVLVDGQRLNSLDSSGIRFAQLPMSSIERIEIRKANGGALYGDRAQGGVINIITRGDEAKEVGVSVGSFGTRKLDAYLGLKTDDVRGSVALMSASSDGYRAYSESRQNSAQIKLATSGDWGRLGFFARGFEEKAQLPSYLTPQEFASDPRKIGAYPIVSERSGGATGVRYDRAVGSDSTVSLDMFHQSSQEKLYSTIHNTRTAFNPEFRARWGSGQWVIGGEFSDTHANTEDGKQVSQYSQSLYAQTTQPVLQTLNLEIGARKQKVSNDFQASVSGDTTSASSQKSGLSAALRHQLSANTVLRAGALTGFRFANADELYYFAPVFPYALLAINPQVKPMSTREYFVQMEQTYAAGKFDVHYRNIYASDEIGSLYSCGTIAGTAASCNTNLYDTQRQVLSVNGHWKPTTTLTLKAGLDFVDATIDSGANAGNRIPLTAKRVTRLTAEQRMNGYTLIATTRYRSNMIQSSDQSAFYPLMPSRNVVDLGMSTSLSKTVSLSAWIRNLFDKSYYDVAQYNGLYPADGRGLFINLKASL
jgi:iron complex outermembrane receptor protein